MSAVGSWLRLSGLKLYVNWDGAGMTDVSWSQLKLRGDSMYDCTQLCAHVVQVHVVILTLMQG